MRRALIFAHYDPHGIVDGYVLHSLACYRRFFELIVFVSTSDLNREQVLRTSLLADRVILRPNIGYDFFSWRAGFRALPVSVTYDTVVFANDSCYGPCCDLKPFFSHVELMNVDLWGASLNEQFRRHVQSYFMGFGRKLMQSGFARDFWSSLRLAADKQDLILTNEVGLSSKVEEAGFRIGALVDYRRKGRRLQQSVLRDNHSAADSSNASLARQHILAENYPNPVQLYAVESLRRGLPFVKVELVRDNPLNANL